MPLVKGTIIRSGMSSNSSFHGRKHKKVKLRGSRFGV